MKDDCNQHEEVKQVKKKDILLCQTLEKQHFNFERICASNIFKNN